MFSAAKTCTIAAALAFGQLADAAWFQFEDVSPTCSENGCHGYPCEIFTMTCAVLENTYGCDCSGCKCLEDPETTTTAAAQAAETTTTTTITTSQQAPVRGGATTTPGQNYSFASGHCSTYGMCAITTTEECQQAASIVGMEDTGARTFHKTDRNPGCFRSRAGNLKFNTAFEDNVHPSTTNRDLICGCAANAGQYVIQNDGGCDGVVFCPLTSVESCHAAAAAIGLADQTALEIDKASNPSGCYLESDDDLVFNVRTSGTGDNRVVCGRC